VGPCGSHVFKYDIITSICTKIIDGHSKTFYLHLWPDFWIFKKLAIFYPCRGALHKHCPGVVQRLSGIVHWQLYVTLGGKSLHIVLCITKSCPWVIYRYCSDTWCIVHMQCEIWLCKKPKKNDNHKKRAFHEYNELNSTLTDWDCHKKYLPSPKSGFGII
jgi:hypothetical protein